MGGPTRGGEGGGHDNFLRRSLFRGHSPFTNGHIRGTDVVRCLFIVFSLSFPLVVDERRDWITTDFCPRLSSLHLPAAIAIALRSNHIIVRLIDTRFLSSILLVDVTKR